MSLIIKNNPVNKLAQIGSDSQELVCDFLADVHAPFSLQNLGQSSKYLHKIAKAVIDQMYSRLGRAYERTPELRTRVNHAVRAAKNEHEPKEIIKYVYSSIKNEVENLGPQLLPKTPIGFLAPLTLVDLLNAGVLYHFFCFFATSTTTAPDFLPEAVSFCARLLESDDTFLVKGGKIKNFFVSYKDKFAAIKAIGFANSNLKKIPLEISYLSNLEILDLSNSQLEVLPNDFNQLVKLKKLNLSHGLFRNVPTQILSLTELETLDLSNNRLENLPKMGQLVKLQELDISHNLFAGSQSSFFDAVLKLLHVHFHRDGLEFLPNCCLRRS